jgi:hypothetical protein
MNISARQRDRLILLLNREITNVKINLLKAIIQDQNDKSVLTTIEMAQEDVADFEWITRVLLAEDVK